MIMLFFWWLSGIRWLRVICWLSGAEATFTKLGFDCAQPPLKFLVTENSGG